MGNIAIAFELPLVVSNVGGLPELVKDSRPIIEPNNPIILADVITEILSNKVLYGKLQRDAAVLKRQYTWSAAVGATMEVYRKILS